MPDDMGDGGTTDASEDDSTGGMTDEGGDETEGAPMCDVIEGGGLVPEPTMVPADCEEALDHCKKDQDRDGVVFGCDNAPDASNPAQRDADEDGLGDVIDLCPVVAGENDDFFDSDEDGIGNSCDSCPTRGAETNLLLEAAGVPFRYWVRNIPTQLDTDGDGIGDACDNCPITPNCAGFAGSVLDDPPLDDPSCQADSDGDGIGDACESLPNVSFDPQQDFDGDGLANNVDTCPRLVSMSACSTTDDCPAASACMNGTCNHPDTDGDGVGDACDTCPGSYNPEQVAGEEQADLDDADGDFIGSACEMNVACESRSNATPPAFFDVAVDGVCCVLTWPGDDQLMDPDGRPLRTECADESECRGLPANVLAAPGVATMWPGCEEALALACKQEASPVTLDDVAGDLAALWSYQCRLPPVDHDFDGIPDTCDLCPFAHDPTNLAFVDVNGMEWPNDGHYCNGDYDANALDPANGCLPG